MSFFEKLRTWLISCKKDLSVGSIITLHTTVTKDQWKFEAFDFRRTIFLDHLLDKSKKLVLNGFSSNQNNSCAKCEHEKTLTCGCKRRMEWWTFAKTKKTLTSEKKNCTWKQNINRRRQIKQRLKNMRETKWYRAAKIDARTASNWHSFVRGAARKLLEVVTKQFYELIHSRARSANEEKLWVLGKVSKKWQILRKI